MVQKGTEDAENIEKERSRRYNVDISIESLSMLLMILDLRSSCGR